MQGGLCSYFWGVTAGKTVYKIGNYTEIDQNWTRLSPNYLESPRSDLIHHFSRWSNGWWCIKTFVSIHDLDLYSIKEKCSYVSRIVFIFKIHFLFHVLFSTVRCSRQNSRKVTSKMDPSRYNLHSSTMFHFSRKWAQRSRVPMTLLTRWELHYYETHPLPDWSVQKW